MAIRLLRKGEDPALRSNSKEIGEITNSVLTLLDDMIETMRFNNGIGLAAPQVGVPKRVVVIELDDQVYELINPIITAKSGSEVDVEGCLSFPGIWGEVERYTNVTVEALGRDGQRMSILAEGLMARALQHELDHLDGILFVDRVTKFVDIDQQE